MYRCTCMCVSVPLVCVCVCVYMQTLSKFLIEDSHDSNNTLSCVYLSINILCIINFIMSSLCYIKHTVQTIKL